MRVLAALSGGVDSAVAAARAVAAGHEVVGIHMALSKNRAQFREGSRGCCSIEDATDARRAADILGIPFYVWDLSDTFEERVVADFLTEYAAGRTPNPCVRCNEHIKFDTLLARASALGFDAVATGHYARIKQGPEGLELHRSVDKAKDQSYVLAVMGPDKLSRALFPLGDVASKAQVRAEADERGLRVANKPDSYDICFIPDGNTAGFLRSRLGQAPGEVVDEHGEVLAHHEGTHAFTIGQRKGLGIEAPAPDGKPRYVLSIEPVSRRVVVGSAAALAVSTVRANDVVWFVSPRQVERAELQFRAHGRPVAVKVQASETQLVLVAQEPMRAVAAGQSAVLYEGTKVLAQATIASAS